MKKLCICVRLQNRVAKQDIGWEISWARRLWGAGRLARVHCLLVLIILFMINGS